MKLRGDRRFFPELRDLSLRRVLFLSCVCFMLLMVGSAALALRPDQILVLANKNAKSSVGLAKEYMKLRDIPSHHLLELWITDKEHCSREDYESKVAPVVREYLEKIDPNLNIRCLVTFFGLPLKISPPVLNQEEKAVVDGLKQEQKALRLKLEAVAPEKKEERVGIIDELDKLKKRIRTFSKSEYRSSFDSELSLVRVKDYDLNRWIPNPIFVGYKNQEFPISRDLIMMVSRLDGPTEEIVERIIRDSMEVEKEGLKGTAYFDARWPRPDEAKAKTLNMGYGFYDWSIYLAAEKVQKAGDMKVVVNDKPELFQPGDCPDAALYCGWYRLGKYIDAFDWQPGAVGFHIASSECATLKGKNSQVWCKRMLEEGVAATVGPVGEPYVHAFPVPEAFFGFLMDGRWSLAECYILSVPSLSWQMVLVGDPLYAPFEYKRRR